MFQIVWHTYIQYKQLKYHCIVIHYILYLTDKAFSNS